MAADATTQQPARVIRATGRAVSVLAGGALAAYGLGRRSPLALGFALVGGALAYRGAFGRLPLAREGNGQLPRGRSPRAIVHAAITIQRSKEDLFSAWRDFSMIPVFMRHIASVHDNGDGTWHWVARTPPGLRLEWDTRIEQEEAPRLIRWRSVFGSEVDAAGQATFSDAPGDRGAQVALALEYASPAMKLGLAVGRMLGDLPGRALRADLRRWKELMECGEIPTIDGQAKGH